MRRNIVTLIFFAALGLLIYEIESKSCNKKGTIADKINWAGHNCK